MSAPNLKPMSVEEYLRSEEASPFKREYVGGFVYPLYGRAWAQAGTTAGHVQICMNISFGLRTAARRAGCRLYQSDMKLRVEATDNFYYSGVMAVCGQAVPDPGAVYVTSPCLLIEVTSKSTARNDRVAKHAAYTALPSLQTYLIVEQDRRRVYAYGRAGDRWQLEEVAGQGAVDLPCLSYTDSVCLRPTLQKHPMLLQRPETVLFPTRNKQNQGHIHVSSVRGVSSRFRASCSEKFVKCARTFRNPYYSLNLDDIYADLAL